MRRLLISVLLLTVATGATVSPDSSRTSGSGPGSEGARSSDARLLAATRDRDVEAASAALAAGASLETTAADGATPLAIAAQLGSDELVDLFLSRGAAVDSRDPSGWTALLHASAQGSRRPFSARVSS